MADIDDRWFRTVDGEKVKTARHGKGQRYAARYRDRDGKQRSPTFATVREARDHLAKVRTDLREGTFVDPAQGRITLAAYAALWFDGYSPRSATTREAVEARLRLHITPYLGTYQLVTIAANPELITRWLGKLQLADVRPVKTLLSQILRAAKDNGRIARNPCELKSVQGARPAPSKPRVTPWRSDEVTRLHVELPERYRAGAVLAVGCGLRVGEVLGLAVEDVDWFQGNLTLRRQVKVVAGRQVFDLPKGGRERDVPLPEWVKLALAASLKTYPAVSVTLPWAVADGAPTTASLIFTRNGAAVKDPWFDMQVWTPARVRAGIDYGVRRNGIHQLRHTYASTLLAGGVDIRTVSEYLGHHDAAFTLRTYVHLMPNAEARTRAAIDDAFGQGAPDVRQRVVEGL